jgi:hypothetical protein
MEPHTCGRASMSTLESTVVALLLINSRLRVATALRSGARVSSLARRARFGREAVRRLGVRPRDAGSRRRDQALAVVRPGADLRGDRLTGPDRRLLGFGIRS